MLTEALDDSNKLTSLFGAVDADDYARGIDDVAFNVGKLLGKGCKQLSSHLVGNSYEISVSDMNFSDCVREVAKIAQDGDDRIYNVFSNVRLGRQLLHFGHYR